MALNNRMKIMIDTVGHSWQFREKKVFYQNQIRISSIGTTRKGEKNKIQQNTQILRQNFIKDRSSYFQIRNL